MNETMNEIMNHLSREELIEQLVKERQRAEQAEAALQAAVDSCFDSCLFSGVSSSAMAEAVGVLLEAQAFLRDSGVFLRARSLGDRQVRASTALQPAVRNLLIEFHLLVGVLAS